MPASLQSLANLVSSAPSGANGYEFAARRTFSLFFPAGHKIWLLVLFVSLTIIYAAIAILCVYLLVRRFARRLVWFFRFEETRAGRFCVPQVVNVGLVCNFCFALSGLASIWLADAAYRRGDAVAFAEVITLKGIVWISLTAAALADIVTLTISSLDFKRVVDSSPKPAAPAWIAPTVNVLTFLVPLIVSVVAIAFFGIMRATVFADMLEIHVQIRDKLLELAPTWTGGISSTDVATFEPLLQAAGETTMRVGRWMRIGFALWLGAAVIVYGVWMVLLRQFIAIVRWQIAAIQQVHRVQARQRARVIDLDQDVREAEPHMKLSRLLGVVRFRLLQIACLTAAIICYIVLLALVVAMSTDLAENDGHLERYTIAGLFAYLLIALPCLVAAVSGQSDESAVSSRLGTSRFISFEVELTRRIQSAAASAVRSGLEANNANSASALPLRERGESDRTAYTFPPSGPTSPLGSPVTLV